MSKRRDSARSIRLTCAALGCAAAVALCASSADAQMLSKPRRATAAYFGDNVVNPGASLGYEAAFYYRRPHELFGGAHIGGYNSADPPLYGVFIYIEGGYRLNFNVGFFLEARVGLGYVNVTRSSIVTLDDGSMAQGPNITGNYLTPLGMGGLGFDLLPKTRVPISLFADVGGMGRYSATEGFTGGLIFTTGLAYQFGTSKPRPVETQVPPTPPAVAPPNLEGSELPPGVENTTPPGPAVAAPPAPSSGPIAPVPAPAPAGEAPPPPQLPPPPIYPGN